MASQYSDESFRNAQSESSSYLRSKISGLIALVLVPRKAGSKVLSFGKRDSPPPPPPPPPSLGLKVYTPPPPESDFLRLATAPELRQKLLYTTPSGWW